MYATESSPPPSIANILSLVTVETLSSDEHNANPRLTVKLAPSLPARGDERSLLVPAPSDVMAWNQTTHWHALTRIRRCALVRDHSYLSMYVREGFKDIPQSS
jgi:hypothetical protein